MNPEEEIEALFDEPEEVAEPSRPAKAPPTGPTPEQTARWEVEEGVSAGEQQRAHAERRPASSDLSPLLDYGAAAARDAGASPITAALGPLAERLAPGSAARGRERAQRVYDDYVQSDADLGGRNPLRPIVGEDRRSEALVAGIGQGSTLGFADELGGMAQTIGGGDYSDARDEIRERTERVAEQSPEMYGAGELAGSAPYALINPASAGGRMALSTGLGLAAGAGHSEGDVGTTEFATDTALGGGLGLAGGALAEVPTAAGAALRGDRGRELLRSLSGRFRRGADRAQEGADQALLEATGFWGQRALDQIDRAGGPASVASDLRRYGIGRGGGQSIPRMQQAADDLATLGRGGGDTMGLVAQTADEAGATIPSQRIIEAAEREATRLDQLGTATARRAAERIRNEVAPLAERPEMSLSDAWRLRRHFDSMADFSGGAGADDVARTSGEQFRSLRGHLDREMDSALQSVGMGREWDEASRMAQLGILSREAGAGHRRLSVGGGMGGAGATGDLIADAVSSNNPLRMLTAIPSTLLARMGSQEARMVAPGAISRVREGSAAAQRGLSERLAQMARRSGPATGSPLLQTGQRAALLDLLGEEPSWFDAFVNAEEPAAAGVTDEELEALFAEENAR